MPFWLKGLKLCLWRKSPSMVMSNIMDVSDDIEVGDAAITESKAIYV